MSDARPAQFASSHRRPAESQPFRIERSSYLKIAAIEGLAPTRAADGRAIEFDHLQLSPQQRRQAIIEAHRPKR